MNYHPDGVFIYDSWYFHHDGLSHCIHLQQLRPGETPPGVLEGEFSEERGAIGHATSTDLITWETQPTAIYRGEPGSYDDYDLWTGSVFQSDDTSYLYYTARSSWEKGTVNRIALATSKDNVRWERYEGNPILTPDSRWYHGESNPRPFTRALWPTVDCRDFCVIADPEGDGYWGYYAARQPATEIASTAVIALAHSDDLVNWTQHPPCFAPGKYAVVEVPDVFFLDGRWYLICLTGNMYGQRNRTSEPNLGGPATIYAVADKPQGPYRELNENVLFGSENWQGFCGRTLGVDDERYLFYTQGEDSGGSPAFGSISTPKLLATDSDGHLLATYSNRIEQYVDERLVPSERLEMITNEGQWGSLGEWNVQDRGVEAACGNDWAVRIYDSELPDFVYSARISFDDVRSAGLIFRVQGSEIYAGSYIVLLDVKEKEVVFTDPVSFKRIEGRKWDLRAGASYHLRIVGLGKFYNVYIDDVLCLQLHHPDLSSGRFGLFVEEGRASFSEIEAMSLAARAR